MLQIRLLADLPNKIYYFALVLNENMLVRRHVNGKSMAVFLKETGTQPTGRHQEPFTWECATTRYSCHSIFTLIDLFLV